MGVVYEARHDLDEGRYAIKVIAPHLASDPSVRDRFLREIRTARRLRHPNIIETETPFVHEGQIYLPMVFLEGPTLDERLKSRGGPFPEGEVRSLFQQAAEGLSFAHRAGVLHRDIKPANIHVDDRGHLRILDFGLAKAITGDTLTEAGAMLGTPVYLSPEYIETGRATAAGDVFALGLVAFQLATGQRAIPELDPRAPLLAMIHRIHQAHLRGLPAPRDLIPELSGHLDALIRRSLASEASCRFPDGFALAAAFEHPDPDALFDPEGLYRGPTLVDAPTVEVEREPSRTVDPLAASPQGPEPAPARTHGDPSEAALAEPRSGRAGGGLGAVLKLGSVAAGLIAALATGWWLVSGHADGPVVTSVAPENVDLGVAAADPSRAAAPLAATLGTDGGLPLRDVGARSVEGASAAAVDAGARSVEGASSAEVDAGAATSPPPRGMVRVEAGRFHFGCGPTDRHCDPDERPGRTVELPAFAIGRTEVSVADYRACVDAGACSREGTRAPGCPRDGETELPMRCVDRAQAEAFCRWFGGRLPTEAEWEKAARGTDGRTYPWGAGRPSCERANTGACRREEPLPVDSLPGGASPSGALHMAGNVWEWVQTRDRARVRGGSFRQNVRAARASNRNELGATTHSPTVGFRCAASP